MAYSFLNLNIITEKQNTYSNSIVIQEKLKAKQ